MQKTENEKKERNDGNQYGQKIIIQNAAIFADDAKLFSEEDAHE